MAQALGIIDVVWLGTKISADQGSGSIDVGGLMNQPVIAGQKVHNAQKMMPSEVEITTPLLSGVSLTSLVSGLPGELQVVCDTGQIFIIPDAFLVVTPKASAGDGGKVSLKWNGSAALEIS